MDHWADYVIFVTFLLISLAIGLYHAFSGGKQRTNEEFIMADRKLKIVPTSVSITVSYMSALMIIGGPAEMYAHGVMAWPGYRIGAGVSLVVLVMVVVPWIYELRLTSVYSYFRLRYGHRAIQVYTAVLGIVSLVLYTGVAIYAPSVAMETATGFPAKASIPIMAVVCIVYTALGGMRAVIWTDVFQAAIMVAGMLAIMIKVILAVGGVVEAFDKVKEEERLEFNLSPDPTVRHTLWAFLIGNPFADIFISGLSQTSVQRYSALQSRKQAQLMPVLWYIGSGVVSSFSFLSGLCLVAYYSLQQCDPIASKQIHSSNQIVPYFVKHSFKNVQGFSGLFLATMYSATLSTVSSSLSAASAIAWTDLVQPQYPRLPDVRATLVSKALVVIFGLLSTGFAFTVSYFKGPILAVTMALFGACNGPIGGMFFLGGLRIFHKVEWKSVLLGGIGGFAANLWVTLGSITVDGKHPPLPPVSTAGCSPTNDTLWASVYNHTGDAQYQHWTTPHSGNTTIHTATGTTFHGLERFYTLSYLYYPLFGLVVTMLTALLTDVIIKCVCKQRTDVYVPDDSVFMTFTRHKKTRVQDVREAEPLQETKMT